MGDIAYNSYVRTPFAVEATVITAENIDEIAKLIGTEVRAKGDDKYIAIDRRIVPNVGRAFIGWYVTRLGDNLRCYSPKIFQEQFVDMPEDRSMTFHFPVEEADPVVTPETTTPISVSGDFVSVPADGTGFTTFNDAASELVTD